MKICKIKQEYLEMEKLFLLSDDKYYPKNYLEGDIKMMDFINRGWMAIQSLFYLNNYDN